MQLDITIIQLIIICAVSNGFVFGFLLLEKRENRFANRFLALTIICMCLTFTPYMLDPSIWHTYRWLTWMPFSLSYWIGPSFYFYVRTLSNPALRFTKKELWHFTPIVLNYVHSIYHGFFFDNQTPWHWFHFVAEILESAAILSILVYMVLSLKVTRKYRKVLLDNVSNTNAIDLKWVKNIIIVIIVSFLSILIFLIVSSGVSGKHLLGQWNKYRAVVLLLYAGVLYWISIHGYRQAQTLKLKRTIKGTSTFQDRGTVGLIQKLDTFMVDQKLFRNPDLSLASLSKAVGISERAISEAINNKLDKNFYQFVNEYRINEIQKKLRDPKNSNFKIISLALDSGFNSKATFNRIFKSYTGLTPKEYKSQKEA